MSYINRTAYCAEFGKEYIDRRVTAAGWVQRRRVLGGLIFIDLRDRTGILQIAFDEQHQKELFDLAYTLRSEDVIAVTGVIRPRGEGAVNKNMKTGEIELRAEELKVLGKSETPPFEIVENSNCNEELRL
ncbi:MAG: OB-fold nucleic acid binding domain-containing protein, partial [Eubacteriales bacterium]